MANFTFGNNPNQPIPATYDEQGNELTPVIPAEPSPSAKVIDSNGIEKVVAPGECVGLEVGSYTIEVIG